MSSTTRAGMAGSTGSARMESRQSPRTDPLAVLHPHETVCARASGAAPIPAPNPPATRAATARGSQERIIFILRPGAPRHKRLRRLEASERVPAVRPFGPTSIAVLVALRAIAAGGDVPADRALTHRLVGILDYLAVDYPPTVRDGRVIIPTEYDEQVNLAGEARRIAERLPRPRAATPDARPTVGEALAEVERRVRARADGVEVRRAILEARRLILG